MVLSVCLYDYVEGAVIAAVVVFNIVVGYVSLRFGFQWPVWN